MYRSFFAFESNSTNWLVVLWIDWSANFPWNIYNNIVIIASYLQLYASLRYFCIMFIYSCSCCYMVGWALDSFRLSVVSHQHKCIVSLSLVVWNKIRWSLNLNAEYGCSVNWNWSQRVVKQTNDDNFFIFLSLFAFKQSHQNVNDFWLQQ